MNEEKEQNVAIKDFNMPFSSMVILMVKWAIASIPAIIINRILFTFIYFYLILLSETEATTKLLKL